MKRINKKGFSLLELLLVLGIIAALIVAAFIVYPKVQDANRAAAEAKNISALMAGVKSLYSGQANYKGLDDQVAYKAKIYPDNMVIGNGTNFVNSYSGTVSVEASANTSTGEDDSGFRIKYTLLPTITCAKIITEVGSNFYEINANGVTLEPSTMKPSDITAACAARDGNAGSDGAYLIMYAE